MAEITESDAVYDLLKQSLSHDEFTQTKNSILLHAVHSNSHTGDQFRSAVLRRQAQQMVDAIGRPKVKITLSSENEKSKKMLQECFPQYNIEFDYGAYNGHSVAYAVRILEARDLYDRAKGYVVNTKDQYDHDIIDVGGAWAGHYLKGDKIHSCTPVIDARDSVRHHEHLIKTEVRDIDYDNLKADYSCGKLAQVCERTAPVVTFLHSIYDMSVEMVANVLERKGAYVGFAIFNPAYGLLLEHAEGKNEKLNYEWFTHGLDDKKGIVMRERSHSNFIRVLQSDHEFITFTFKSDASLNYTHSIYNIYAHMITSVYRSTNDINNLDANAIIKTGEIYESVIKHYDLPHLQLKNNEIERLRKENEALQAQLTTQSQKPAQPVKPNRN